MTGWPSLLVSMYLLYPIPFKLFSCIVRKRMSAIEFSATEIDITVQLVGASPLHPYQGCALDPVGGLSSSKPARLPPNLYTLASPVRHIQTGP